ncbi:uncharacterized protein LOC110932942 [Helianthus annuus]|uniref:uncharacterized protein LOC110932942 n=1 Tax=Helianthus annuus TaxID=4232 RepID=UPI001652E1B3|nr:uncharacterized protein LOC110932942 [Helianthus annuus]
MDIFDNDIYITTGWNRIKKEMSITDHHLVVFEMLDLHTFEMSVFCCKPTLLTLPPELCVVKEEPTNEVIDISDDDLPNPIPVVGVEESTDDEVPIVFRVDNHYRLKKKWAQLHGLDRKRDLIIKDSAGLTWDVSIGVEHSEGYPRYNVTGMKNFVRDKQLVKGSEFHMVYVKSKGGVPLHNEFTTSTSTRFSIVSNIVTQSSNSIGQSSSTLTKLNSGKQKLLPKKRRIDPIPMLDLTSDDENVVFAPIQDPCKGVSTDYLDHGNQSLKCEMCDSLLWTDEGGKGRITLGKLTYSLCCGYGKVELPDLKEPSSIYKDLFANSNENSKYFLKNIRRYNSMFSFTSMGGKVDSSINSGRAPYVFRISGQNFHTLGGLVPAPGKQPKFSQLYIYDTENEVSNRNKLFSDSKNKSDLHLKQIDLHLIKFLKDFLDNNNQLVKSYRIARNHFNDNPNENFKLRIIYKRDLDGRTYNLPSSSEVAALIVGGIQQIVDHRDIVVESHTEGLQRISELHPSYLALQYPILFPNGDDGYRIDIPHRDGISTLKKISPKCTMREFFAYRIQDRSTSFSLILNARRLFQQFLVDAYTMIESERLNYIRFQQKHLRSESYTNLQKFKNEGKEDLSNTGVRLVLPSSFTGGSRYMQQNYLDAMAICKWFGYPDFFITVTCNPKWPEIIRYLRNTSIKQEDRPDIMCRLFKMKLDSIIKDLKDKKVLGALSAAVYTVEFQKRGLPHAHICIFLKPESKLLSVDHIDKFISAEIPDKIQDPALYALVSEFMIHGPCGNANPNCPCMVDNRCSKKFPKKFINETITDAEGFPVYRRRDNGNTIMKSKVQLDNRSVVPYNPLLLKRYQAHINVEWCNQAGSIKYLFKYINKGPDKASLVVSNGDGTDNEKTAKDEIKAYYDCRYVSACEASWRIFANEVHYRFPPVMRLPFHMEGQQNVVFGAEDDIEEVLDKPSVSSSIFLKWMEMNINNEEARKLTYVEFPTKFCWKLKDRNWAERKRKLLQIGRIHSVSPALGEPYFLRILLNKVKGPRSFEEIRTVDGQLFPTFRDACYAMGLLDDDMEYIEAIKEASFTGDGRYIRALFVTLLLSNTLSRPEFVFEQTWKYLGDDILYKTRKETKNKDLVMSDDRLKNKTLVEIEKYLIRNGSSLTRWPTIPYPDYDSFAVGNNRLVDEELSFSVPQVQSELDSLKSSLTDEQLYVYNQIMTAVEGEKGGVFFVYGYGGTGKTFLWKTLALTVRSREQIVLNVASSGIASLLMSRGRTAHSRFHIPINLDESSMCHIRPDGDVAYLLKQTRLIIWDKAPMVHRHAFEALGRTLKDIFVDKSNCQSDVLFGGKVIVFGGDFRQILPVIPNGSRQEIVNASLSSSYIWPHCKLLTLTKNMRLTVGVLPSTVESTKRFAQWLLDIGEGKVGGDNDGVATVEIPSDLLITDSLDPIESLIQFVYPSVLERYKDRDYFSERAILTPKNEVVHEINDRLLELFPGEATEYLSSDSICATEKGIDSFQQELYSPDVLNGLKISGLPNHRLVLKLGVPIMLLRNIDQQNGLCNGTRLQVTFLGKRVIEAEIISGANVGTRTFIPRISMIPSDKKIPFAFQRRQFPVAVCFAMTINKSQGQSLSKVGLFLKEPVFTHGQLYVALSRVKSREGVKMLILDKDGKPTNTTTNVERQFYAHIKRKRVIVFRPSEVLKWLILWVSLSDGYSSRLRFVAGGEHYDGEKVDASDCGLWFAFWNGFYETTDRGDEISGFTLTNAVQKIEDAEHGFDNDKYARG